MYLHSYTGNWKYNCNADKVLCSLQCTCNGPCTHTITQHGPTTIKPEMSTWTLYVLAYLQYGFTLGRCPLYCQAQNLLTPCCKIANGFLQRIRSLYLTHGRQINCPWLISLNTYKPPQWCEGIHTLVTEDPWSVHHPKSKHCVPPSQHTVPVHRHTSPPIIWG